MNLPGILQIGGTERNIGKTLLACRILEHFSKQHSITAVKISVIDNLPKGSPEKGYRDLSGKYLLTEENTDDKNSNTYRFLESGAVKAFWLRTRGEFFKEAFEFALKTIGQNQLMICESNHLRNYFKPGAFIMLYNHNAENYKESSLKILDLADIRIDADKDFNSFNSESLNISEKGWSFSKP
ncbi:MAG: hypothetical protein V2A54_16965 [Bacteroidota bacterium]